jgi:hypothetical protein
MRSFRMLCQTLNDDDDDDDDDDNASNCEKRVAAKMIDINGITENINLIENKVVAKTA